MDHFGFEVDEAVYEDPSAPRGLAAVHADLARLVRLRWDQARLRAAIDFLDRRESLGLTPEGKDAIVKGLRKRLSPDEILAPLVAAGLIRLPDQ